jgi:hypothetical protein
MNKRQRYAITHPLDGEHPQRMETCRRYRCLDNGSMLCTILAVDR